ncbi:MAG: ISL3 family transposase [Actinomycetota bacterium]|nr:ISL3 family transposase [Actinomycetota bacterium]
MRVKSVLRKLLGLCASAVVVGGWELVEDADGGRPTLVVKVRRRARQRGRCGRCGAVAPWFDQGGGTRRWRHLDVGFATCELVGDAPRVSCPTCGVTVAEVSFARHDSAFTRAFEDLVVFDAICSSKLAAARRHGVSWRAVDHMCIRVAREALGRVDLLSGLVAIAIDEVKYKKGQRYLTVVCDHLSGKVIWAAKGRRKDTVSAFFDALGDERAEKLQFVTCDGAEWIRTVVAERAKGATICLDTFHLIGWATDALDDVRREEWNSLRRTGRAKAAKEFKGLRWMLLRNWENLTSKQKGTIRELERANTRAFRAWQLKEELRDIMAMPLIPARRALDDWLAYASRSRLAPFVKLARTIRNYRTSIEATIEWKLTNGISESNNAAIGRIRSAARGFHDPESFITMIMLDRAGIAPKLPWAS